MAHCSLENLWRFESLFNEFIIFLLPSVSFLSFSPPTFYISLPLFYHLLSYLQIQRSSIGRSIKTQKSQSDMNSTVENNKLDHTGGKE